MQHDNTQQDEPLKWRNIFMCWVHEPARRQILYYYPSSNHIKCCHIYIVLISRSYWERNMNFVICNLNDNKIHLTRSTLRVCMSMEKTEIVLCTVAFYPFIMIIIFFVFFSFWAAASEHFMKRVGKRFTKIVNFSFIWVFCALFLEFSRFRSWHIKSFIRFNAKFSAGKVGAWNQRMGKSIDNFICVRCARVLYSTMMFMTSFLILLDSAFFCFLSLFFLSISVRSCVLFFGIIFTKNKYRYTHAPFVNGILSLHIHVSNQHNASKKERNNNRAIEKRHTAQHTNVTCEKSITSKRDTKLSHTHPKRNGTCNLFGRCFSFCFCLCNFLTSAMAHFCVWGSAPHIDINNLKRHFHRHCV